MIYTLKPRDSYYNEKVYIFDIPRANSVGSLNIYYSSLTAIEFDRNGKLDYNRIKRKRDIDMMDGNSLMLPE